MKEPKKYHVNTVQDMIDCTNPDNVDNFLKDLGAMLSGAHMMQSLNDLTGIKTKIKSDGFTWIDDDEHNITLNINPIKD